MSAIYTKIDTKKTGENIKDLRTSLGLSVIEMQDMLGCAKAQSIYSWERGATLPSIENLMTLSKIYQVPVEEIVAIDS